MAVTEHPPACPVRFRVTRSWKNRKFQSYVPFGKDKEKARLLAQQLDLALAERQRAYLLRREIEGLHVLHPDGRIIGLQRQQQSRSDGRAPSDTFKIRIVVDGQPPVFKTVEICSIRTFDQAFEVAVSFIAETRGIDKNDRLFQRMLDAKACYQNAPERQSTQSRADSNDQGLFEALQLEVANFQKRIGKNVLRG